MRGECESGAQPRADFGSENASGVAGEDARAIAIVSDPSESGAPASSREQSTNDDVAGLAPNPLRLDARDSTKADVEAVGSRAGRRAEEPC